MGSITWRLLPAVCILTACAASTTSFTDEDRTAVAAEIAGEVAGLTAAMNSGDPDRVMSFYSGDSNFVYLGCTSYIMGGEVFSRIVSPSYRAGAGTTFEQEIVATQVLGTDAAVVSVRGGSSQAPNLFWTQTWQRGEDGWAITLEHESWPGCTEPREPHPFTSESPVGGTGGDGSER